MKYDLNREQDRISVQVRQENWLPVVGYELIYEVSDFGIIRTKERISNNQIARRRKIKPSRILSAYKRKDGYLDISLSKNGERKVCLIHRIVATAFLENSTGLPIVNHKDGNKSNNHISNLEWCDNIQNSAHAWQTGLMRNHIKGSRVHFSKLTEADIPEIKRRISNSETHLSIANSYGVDQSIISCIKHGKIWKHV